MAPSSKQVRTQVSPAGSVVAERVPKGTQQPFKAENRVQLLSCPVSVMMVYEKKGTFPILRNKSPSHLLRFFIRK